jgi:hypothetical protein
LQTTLGFLRSLRSFHRSIDLFEDFLGSLTVHLRLFKGYDCCIGLPGYFISTSHPSAGPQVREVAQAVAHVGLKAWNICYMYVVTIAAAKLARMELRLDSWLDNGRNSAKTT